MTETNPCALISHGIAKRAHIGSDTGTQIQNTMKTGRPLPGVELRLLDSNDSSREVAHDGKTVGELAVRGPWITAEYYNPKNEKLPELTSKFCDGFLLTGDVATIDPKGVVSIVDRSKDMIKSGGEWISSADLERHITNLPSVCQACVVGVHHPKWDERPIVVVTAASNGGGGSVSREEVFQHCRTNFASFQIPDDVLVWDSIPSTSVGKIDKKRVREILQDINYKLPSKSTKAPREERSHARSRL